ncbi:MAG: NADAR family protein [Kangiellaceae bacterium]|nr:NADAR family protein [Kangiellaceae bacterium]
MEELRTKDDLVEYVARGKKVKYLCFWGHTKNNAQEVSKTCFSQWYSSKFEIDGIVYSTAEHFMMAEKARLFESKSAANTALLIQIIEAPHPQKAKQLGRQIEGFTNEVWNQHRFDAVVKGNVAKFSQNPKLAEFLLGTGKRVLVEASPADKVWGTGLAEEHDDSTNPFKWKGLNLLGFALMEVREILGKS